MLSTGNVPQKEKLDVAKGLAPFLLVLGRTSSYQRVNIIVIFLNFCNPLDNPVKPCVTFN